MKKCKMIVESCLLWIGIASFLFMTNSFPGNALPSTSADYNGREKRIEDVSDKKMPVLYFTYGPYKSVGAGKYLISIVYHTDKNENVFEVNDSITGEVLKTGHLKAGMIARFAVVDLKNAGMLEVRTSYGGAGSYYLRGIGIISVSSIILTALLALLLNVCLIKYLSERDKDIPLSLMACGVCIALAFFLEPLNFRLGVTILYAFMAYIMISYRQYYFRNILIVNLLSVAVLCFLNFQNYDFAHEYAEIYAFLLCLLFYCAVLLIGKQGIVSELIMEVFTCVVLFYQSAQIIYYSFFKSFFRLSAVLLAKTASGAGRSIVELVSQYQAKCYITVMLCYIILCIIAHICRHSLKRKRKYAGTGK